MNGNTEAVIVLTILLSLCALMLVYIKGYVDGRAGR